MSKKNDRQMVKRFIEKCASLGMTLEQMGAAAGKTKAWASMIVNGKTVRPQWRTRNRMKEFLGEP